MAWPWELKKRSWWSTLLRIKQRRKHTLNTGAAAWKKTAWKSAGRQEIISAQPQENNSTRLSGHWKMHVNMNNSSPCHEMGRRSALMDNSVGLRRNILGSKYLMFHQRVNASGVHIGSVILLMFALQGQKFAWHRGVLQKMEMEELKTRQRTPPSPVGIGFCHYLIGLQTIELGMIRDWSKQWILCPSISQKPSCVSNWTVNDLQMA